MSSQYPEDAKIELVEKEGEVTLYIDGGQAMQAWNASSCGVRQTSCVPGALSIWRLDLAWGFRRCESQATITPPTHRRGEISTSHRPLLPAISEPPANLQIVKADIFDFALTLEPESLDGIFFDPYLSKDVPCDMQQLWGDVLPALVRSLRIGGAFVPYFSPKPELRYHTIIISTESSWNDTPTQPTAEQSTPGEAGDAFIQCFVKTQ